MTHIVIPTQIRFYGALLKTSKVFKLYSIGRALSIEAKRSLRRAVLSREEVRLLESISGLAKTTQDAQDTTTAPVSKHTPCILQHSSSLSNHPKQFISSFGSQAPRGLPPLRVTDAIKRSYLWRQRVNALISREKDLGKIELTPYNNPVLPAEDTNTRGAVFTKQETIKVLKADSVTEGTSKVSQKTAIMRKNAPCILQFTRSSSSSDPPKRYYSSSVSQGQHRGFPQLRGPDEIKQSYLKRQFMNVQRSRDKVMKAEPLTPDNDPTKHGKWR